MDLACKCILIFIYNIYVIPCRQEMQHFVKVMQGYIANQVIHVTWNEFMQALNSDVHNLDDIHKVHLDYLDKAIFRYNAFSGLFLI